MIEIKCAAVETAKTLCASQGLAEAFVLEMTERDTRLGWCAATSEGEESTLLFLTAPDASLTDALLRAMLNALRADGAKTATIADETLQCFMQRKGYFSDSEKQAVKIADFFSKSTCKA